MRESRLKHILYANLAQGRRRSNQLQHQATGRVGTATRHSCLSVFPTANRLPLAALARLVGMTGPVILGRAGRTPLP